MEAHKLAAQGYNSFPQSVGGRQCFNLMKQIEAKSVQISTERVWNEPWPVIQVHYRNITKIHFRLVREDWAAPNQGPLSAGMASTITNARLCWPRNRIWNGRLRCRPRTDYRERIEELPAPKDLKPGFYFLLASPDPSFSDQNNLVTFTDIWVSQPGPGHRTRWGEGSPGRLCAAGRQRRTGGRGRGPGLLPHRLEQQLQGGNHQDRSEWSVSLSQMSAIAAASSWPAPGTSNWPAPTTSTPTRPIMNRQALRTHRLLHRSLPVSSGPDHPVQGHLH